MRLFWLVLVVAAVAVVPAALGANESVVASNFAFTPSTVTVNVGEKVTWTNPEGGFHNVHFADGSFDVPASPSSDWPPVVEREFTAPGTFTYYCEFHQGNGMTGTVVVNGAPGETPTATPPTPTPTSTPTVAPTTGTTPTASPPPGTTPSVPPAATPTASGTPPTFTAKAARRLCLRRSPRCRRPGITLRLTATAAFRVTGTLHRNGRRFGRLSFEVRDGTRTVRFARRTSDGKRLKAGRHRLVLRGAGVTRTLRFTIAAS